MHNKLGIVIIAILLIVLGITIFAGFKVSNNILNNKTTTLEIQNDAKEIQNDAKETEIDKVSIENKNETLESDIKHIGNENLNILIIGVDEGGFNSARSDVMIIATIDKNDNSVKLTSVMRDTLAYIPTSNTYQKLNHSYMEGGPEETMKAINANFDLNINDYVVFDFNAVAKTVDAIGGYPANVTAGEAVDIGVYQGQQILNGNKAIDYMRARKNSGGDTGRNSRQRDLIAYTMKYAKDMGKLEMVNLAIDILPLVRTSFSISDIKDLADIYSAISGGLNIEQYSFPFEYVGTTLSRDKLWYAVPKTMKTNVLELHKSLGTNMDMYDTNDTVNNIDNEIKRISGVY